MARCWSCFDVLDKSNPSEDAHTYSVQRMCTECEEEPNRRAHAKETEDK